MFFICLMSITQAINTDLSPLQASLQVIPSEEAQLWWASKELHRGKKLQDYIGKNEKTKIIVKIQKVCVQYEFYFDF